MIPHRCNHPRSAPRRRPGSLVAAAAAVPLAISLAACAPLETPDPEPVVTQPGPPQMQQGWLPAAPTALERTSEHFVREAAMMNMAELELAELALERAESEDVRAFAQRMVQDHTMMQNDLAQIAQTQNIGMPLGPTGLQRDAVHRLGQLDGRQFDLAYMQQMVEEHQRAIAIHERQARETGNPAMQAIAQQSLPILRDHLREAQQILSRMNGAPPAPQDGAAPMAAPPPSRPVEPLPPELPPLEQAPLPPPPDFTSPRPAPPPQDPG